VNTGSGVDLVATALMGSGTVVGGGVGSVVDVGGPADNGETDREEAGALLVGGVAESVDLVRGERDGLALGCFVLGESPVSSSDSCSKVGLEAGETVGVCDNGGPVTLFVRESDQGALRGDGEGGWRGRVVYLDPVTVTGVAPTTAATLVAEHGERTRGGPVIVVEVSNRCAGSGKVVEGGGQGGPVVFGV
jgi:hypothetical protein